MSFREHPTSAGAILPNIQEGQQTYQKICMTEQGTFGVKLLKDSIQEEDTGTRYRNLKVLLGQAGMASEKLT